jgi:hypothetical protein
MSSEDDKEFMEECVGDIEDLRESYYNDIADHLDEATACECLVDLDANVLAAIESANLFKIKLTAIQKSIQRRQEYGT